MPATSSVLSLDVGSKRIGIAIASRAAGLPRPLVTLIHGENFANQLRDIMSTENVDTIIVGLPRNLSGKSTVQTAASETFAEQLRQQFPNIKIDFQDEALTSKQAEAELQRRGKSYQKADIDALAAVYILEDWLANQSLVGKVSL